MIPVQVLPHGEGLELPAYATAHAAGMDLRAALDEPMTLQPLQRALMPTGLCLAIPAGYEGQIRPRSGLALKHGLTCLNAPGTIDADYRGEVKVLLVNLSAEPCTIGRGERVAQLVISAHASAQWHRVAALPPTERGEGGFGHTGTR